MCDVAQSNDVLCVADTCRDVDIAEVVLLWRRHHCVMTCCDVQCVLRLRVLGCHYTLSGLFLLRSYHFTEHRLQCYYSQRSYHSLNHADFYVPPFWDAVVSAFV